MHSATSHAPGWVDGGYDRTPGGDVAWFIAPVGLDSEDPPKSVDLHLFGVMKG